MKNILIMDDDISIQQLFTQFLVGQGYNVECCSNGIEGLKKMSVFAFDLIIVDIMMPEMDGLEVVQEIRKDDTELPIIAISGGMRHASMNFVSYAQEFGANAIFEKPVSLADLFESVKELLA
ncbi:MAG: response regulator [Kiritimatiellae bacterium]|jgi:CheY-like chemotaxis protein|nr:response regulator [Kiritimatiellia bacterium]